LPHLVLVFTLLIWSLSFLAASVVRRDLSVEEALAGRFLPVLLGALLLIALRWKSFRALPRGAWPKIALMALLGVPLYNLFFFIGMKDVPSGTAALIIASNPAMIALLAWIFLKENFGPRRLAGLLLSLTGVFIVIRYGTLKPVDLPYLHAALLLLLAPLSWSFYTIVGKTMPAGTNPVDATLALLALGSLPLMVFATPHFFHALAAHPAALWGSLYLGIFCTLIGFTAWLWALGKLPAGEVAAFVFLNPPLANLWAWLFEGTPLRPPFILGAVVLLAGVGLIVVRKMKN
jgi:drug/metabolite transporter (DMT)-like permease